MSRKMKQTGGFIAGHQPLRRRQTAVLLLVLLLILSGIGIIILIFIYARVAFIGRREFASREAEQPAEPIDCVLVPGAPVSVDGTPSLMLRNRLSAALDLWQSGRVSTLFLSGDGASAKYDEITPMRRYFEERGVPSGSIGVDPAGFDTYETVYRAKYFYGIRRAYVVTQPFHLSRALYMSNRLTLPLYGIACPMPDNKPALAFRLREIVARVKAFLDCEIRRDQPPPH
jgi:SanA protein